MEKQEQKEKKLPEKVVSIYHGVLSLISKGYDVNSMTVSQITAEAGIGKGTAYDYFKSKEEIIAKALIYDFQIGICQVEEELKKKKNFREGIFLILNWIEKNLESRHGFAYAIHVSGEASEVGNSVYREFVRCEKKCRNYQEIVADIIQKGRAEGLIKEEKEEFAYLGLITQIAGFILFLKEEKEAVSVSREEMKEFLYHNILKILG